MIKNKRFSLLCILVVFCLLICGCGQKTNTASGDTASFIKEQTSSIKNNSSSVEATDSVIEVSSEVSSVPSSKPVVISSKPQKPVAPPVSSVKAYTESETQLPAGSKVCYLTFDDGPSENTLQILDILNKYNAKATFFVVGTGKLEYIKNIVAQGSKVGIHCNSHKYSVCYASDEAYLNDLAAISAKIEGYIGTKPDILRFPGGSSNTVSRTHCKGLMSRLSNTVTQMGYQYFDWNVSSGDAEPKSSSADQIASRVINQAKGKNRICVLMHDNLAKKNTVQALPQIIEQLQAMGYTFEVLSKDMSGFHHGINN